MTMIDATVRLIPEVIGKESSHQDDSFSSAYSNILSIHGLMTIVVWWFQRCL